MDRAAHARWARAVLARDGHTCRHCGQPATEADHIINRAAAPELALDPDNGQALCKPCHRAKTQAEAAAGRASNRLTPWGRDPLPPRGADTVGEGRSQFVDLSFF